MSSQATFMSFTVTITIINLGGVFIYTFKFYYVTSNYTPTFSRKIIISIEDTSYWSILVPLHFGCFLLNIGYRFKDSVLKIASSSFYLYHQPKRYYRSIFQNHTLQTRFGVNNHRISRRREITLPSSFYCYLFVLLHSHLL